MVKVEQDNSGKKVNTSSGEPPPNDDKIIEEKTVKIEQINSSKKVYSFSSVKIVGNLAYKLTAMIVRPISGFFKAIAIYRLKNFLGVSQSRGFFGFGNKR